MTTYYYFENNSYPIHVTDETLKITPYTFLSDGTLWERNELFNFFSIIDVNKEYNIVDIGAQSGLYSLYAKYLPLSTFYSFEPFPDTFKLLNDNINLNHIINVNTYNLAISDKEEKTTLYTSKSHNGLHTLGNNPLRFSDVQKIEVNTTTLDRFFYDRDIPVNYIKIDTEGYEYYILKGGINTIKKYKPVIQIEWCEVNMKQCNVTIDMMEGILNEIGYKNFRGIGEERIYFP